MVVIGYMLYVFYPFFSFLFLFLFLAGKGSEIVHMMDGIKRTHVS